MYDMVKIFDVLDELVEENPSLKILREPKAPWRGKGRVTLKFRP